MHTPGASRRGTAETRARDIRGGIPTISCTNIKPGPQVLGHSGPMCYPASTASDRHP